MKLIIGADIVSTDSNIGFFKNGDMKTLIGEKIYALLEQADFRVFNIEAPITDAQVPIRKAGVCLRMGKEVLPGLKNLNPSIVTLANNHILDYGQRGVEDTIRALEAVNIPYLGIGRTQKSAARIHYLEKDGIRTGIYACAEHEFSIVAQDGWGANPYDPLESFDHIEEAKKTCDFLVVLYHGGTEFYRYPSPEVQRSFRKMAEKGADLVIAQHTHCIGCYEEYKNSTLVYGQGNFIFDRIDGDYWNSGMILEIELNHGTYHISYFPFVKKDGKLMLPDNKTRSKIMEDFETRSIRIKNSKYVKEHYDKYAMKNLEKPIRVLNANTFLFKLINKILGGGLIYKRYKKKDLLGVLNYVECEAHRELIVTGIKQLVPREEITNHG